MEVRDRYAPSPTGFQHIGGLRTALFNYLFAKSRNGKFILRLEDTDRTRFDLTYVDNLYASFEWLGFHWDEGPDLGGPAAPYVQSERFETYRKYVCALVEEGRAYYCFCSAERLDALRREREAARSSESGYDRRCRDIAPEEAARRAAGEPHTIRLKIPLGEKTVFTDALLGVVEWKNDDVSPDPVLLKSDGFPTYHLANVVDDHLMGITHVLRAQEWLASTPLHMILYGAFGWVPPVFCHLPMVMGTDGKKLSKRHGATGLDEFRKNGILPEALVNYVALLGASYEEGKEIYSMEELCTRFSLEKLCKAPAVFDYRKLEWYNARYIRMKTDAELAALALPYAMEAGLFGAVGGRPDAGQIALFNAAMPLVKERAVFLYEIPAKLGYLFSEPPVPETAEFVPKKSTPEGARRLLVIGRGLATAIAALDNEGAEALAKETAEKEGVKLGDLLTPLRAAITGSRVSPPLFGSIRLLGAETCLSRIDRALEKLKAL
ncbi:MAG: glutamate--tRNA ligase [Spirochaetaceae bacterium]|jgi:glutamyl-tRNA synthetase|nr:glutamate--tRNA ligase [Spirochaetaceae bacterium]